VKNTRIALYCAAVFSLLLALVFGPIEKDWARAQFNLLMAILQVLVAIGLKLEDKD
jgi:hypothetical protein